MNCLELRSAAAALALSFGLCVNAGCMIAAHESRVAGNLNVPQSESQSFELGEARSASVDLKLSIGHLTLAGGAVKLMEGEFVHEVNRLKPDWSYTVADGEGRLLIRQVCENVNNCDKRDRNIWNLRLRNDVPLKLKIDFGMGDSHLSLGGLSLQELNLNTGMGSSTIDLTGEWRGDLKAHIETGLGNVTVRLPRQLGVRVNVAKGLGRVHSQGMLRSGSAYTNDAYGKSPQSLQIEVNCGMGSVFLELAG